MPLSPILPGRLPETYRFQRSAGSLRAIQAESTRVQDQVTSGRRIGVSSEDPRGAVRAAFLQRGLERVEQLRVNVDAASSYLAAAEGSQASVADLADRAKALLTSGIGATSGSVEKQAIADEVASLRAALINEGNRTFRGRPLFGGSGAEPPFLNLGGGRTLYTGDTAQTPTFLTADSLLNETVDGHTAFAALTPNAGSPLSPAPTAATRLADLHGGRGVGVEETGGAVTVTLDDGAGGVQTATVDLAGAETLGDLRIRLEAAFAAGPNTLAVAFSADGVDLTPSAGTVGVGEVAGGRTARELAILGGPAAAIVGGDVAPRLSEDTPLAVLNGGTGPGVGTSFRVTQGDRVAVIDLSAAATVGDALNAIRSQSAAADVHVLADLNADGTGLSVRGRVSGENFAIGEEGGTLATGLGLRTFTASTRLSGLNDGRGIRLHGAGGDDPPADGVPNGTVLELTRRDGTAVGVDLAGSITVGDVLDRLNAVDPGVLVASPNAVGNGITLADSSGTGDLSVDPTSPQNRRLAAALGLPTDPVPDGTDLTGEDVHPRRTGGLADILARMETALRSGDDPALTDLGPRLDAEIARLSGTRAEVAARVKRVDDRATRLEEEELTLRESLSDVLDADLTESYTRLTALQTTYEATLRLTARTLNLSLLNFL